MQNLKQIDPGRARSKFNEKMWASKDYVAENKLDGFRILSHVEVDKNRLTTRRKSVKDGNFVEKSDNFPHIRDLFFNEGISGDLEGTVFDGEVIWGKNSIDITTISGCLPEKAVARQLETQFADYYVFDILYDKGEDIRHLPYETRRNILLSHLETIAKPKNHLYIISAEKDDKQSFYEEIIEDGGEGIILKNIHSKYAQDWVKVKRNSTWDVIISGFKDAKEMTTKADGTLSKSKFAEKNLIGALEFGQYVGSQICVFGFCSGMDDALREEISNNKEKYIGRVFTIEAQERIKKSGKFRHPRFVCFRDDKKASECVYRPDES